MFGSGSNGKLCVWDVGGIQDDTIFNRAAAEEDDEEDDCEAVKRAIQVVDKYLTH